MEKTVRKANAADVNSVLATVQSIVELLQGKISSFDNNNESEAQKVQ